MVQLKYETKFRNYLKLLYLAYVYRSILLFYYTCYTELLFTEWLEKIFNHIQMFY